MPELGKLTAIFDADTRKFDAAMRGVQTRLATGITQLQGFTNTTNAASTGLAGLSSKFGLMAGSAVLAASAIGGVVVGLGKLIVSSAKAGGELFDLAQKTSFTVETLSALSNVAKTTGSDIGSISSSLIIFQKNMGAAQDATSRQGELFKSLGIDTRDNEKALRQAFTALAKYGETQKAVEFSTKLFGRSGAAVLAMIKETNGNLDEAIKRYDELGTLISTGAAKASDEFNDVLQKTTDQLEGVTRQIGLQLLPIATEALESISQSLKDNKDEWSKWGEGISDVLTGVKLFAQSEIGQIIGFIAELSVKTNLAILALKALGIAGAEARNAPGEVARREAIGVNESILAKVERLGRTNLPETVTPAGGGGGGGGGRGLDRNRLAQVQLEGVIAQITAEEDTVKRSLDRREIEFEEYFKSVIEGENKRYNATVANIQKEMAGTKDKVKLAELENKLFEENVRHAEKEFELEDQLIEKKKERAEALKLLAVQTDLLAESMRAMEASLLGTADTAVAEFEKILGIPFLFGGTEGGPPSAKPLEDQVEARKKIRETMEGIAQDLTGVFADSIARGFDEGAKAGLVGLAQGLLNVVEQVFLKRLAEGLGAILSNAALGGGGGGSWWKTLLGIGVSALTSAYVPSAGLLKAGQSSGPLSTTGTILTGGLIHRASGGPVWPGQPFLVGERGPEIFMPGQSGNISPNGGSTIININVPVKSAGSYSSPKSRRELAQSIVSALQGAN